MWSGQSCSLGGPDLTLSSYVNLNSPSAAYTIMKALGSNACSLLKDIKQYTTNLIQDFCIIPVVAFSIAFTFTNIGSTLLGSRLSEIGRGLVKFI